MALICMWITMLVYIGTNYFGWVLVVEALMLS